MKRVFLLTVLMALIPAALAQLRTIPQDARRGDMRLVVDTVVEIDGERRLLAPGVMIRNEDNMLIVPGHLPAAAPVKYHLDPEGLVRFLWLLTPEEAAASAPPSPYPR